jgi:hypothetical protein
MAARRIAGSSAMPARRIEMNEERQPRIPGTSLAHPTMNSSAFGSSVLLPEGRRIDRIEELSELGDVDLDDDAIGREADHRDRRHPGVVTSGARPPVPLQRIVNRRDLETLDGGSLAGNDASIVSSRAASRT